MIVRSRKIVVLHVLSYLFAAPSLSSAEPMQCDTGPVEKMYGGTKWLVHSCEDGKSIVIVSAEGNPAMPFYFMVTEIDGKLTLRGEGSGSRDASTAAGRDIEKMMASAGAIDELISETKSAGESEESE